MAESNDSKEKVAKIDRESAQLEVKKFLDLKRVSKLKREKSFDGQISNLVDLMVDDRLTFDFEKKRARLKLAVPLDTKASGKVDSLNLRFYLGMQEGKNILSKVDASDGDARSLAIASALSGISPDILTSSMNELGEKGIDISDHNSLFSYTAFFLV